MYVQLWTAQVVSSKDGDEHFTHKSTHNKNKKVFHVEWLSIVFTQLCFIAPWHVRIYGVWSGCAAASFICTVCMGLSLRYPDMSTSKWDNGPNAQKVPNSIWRNRLRAVRIIWLLHTKVAWHTSHSPHAIWCSPTRPHRDMRQDWLCDVVWTLGMDQWDIHVFLRRD